MKINTYNTQTITPIDKSVSKNASQKTSFWNEHKVSIAATAAVVGGVTLLALYSSYVAEKNIFEFYCHQYHKGDPYCRFNVDLTAFGLDTFENEYILPNWLATCLKVKEFT
jgi:hypothetical protein